jgi:glycosyltransferase involved in cell wall biosynthesis
LRLLYLSNMIPSKGYPQVLEACRVLKQRGRIEFVCDFAGEFVSVGATSDAIAPAEAKRRFLGKIESYDLGDTVRYHGFVGPTAKDRLLADAHVLVLPTRYPGEGQPISIIEGLGRGIPVVSTCHAGIPEMVEDGRNGILLDDPTGEGIADAIEAVASDAERYTQMSACALEIFEARFTKDRYVDDLIAVILGACPGDRAA